MKTNYPTKKTGTSIGPWIESGSKQAVAAAALREAARKVQQERELAKIMKFTAETFREQEREKARFDAEIARLKRIKRTCNRVSLAAGIAALLGWLYILGRLVLK